MKSEGDSGVVVGGEGIRGAPAGESGEVIRGGGERRRDPHLACPEEVAFIPNPRPCRGTSLMRNSERPHRTLQ